MCVRACVHTTVTFLGSPGVSYQTTNHMREAQIVASDGCGCHGIDIVGSQWTELSDWAYEERESTPHMDTDVDRNHTIMAPHIFP